MLRDTGGDLNRLVNAAPEPGEGNYEKLKFHTANIWMHRGNGENLKNSLIPGNWELKYHSVSMGIVTKNIYSWS